MDQSAFPFWFWVLLVLGGLLGWLLFLVIVRVTLSAIENRVEKTLPAAGRYGLTTLIACAILALGLRLASLAQQSWSDYQSSRRLERDQSIEQVCAAAIRPRIFSAPPELIRRIELRDFTADMAKVLANPRQHIPRFAEHVVVQLNQRQDGSFDVLSYEDGAASMEPGSVSDADIRIEAERRIPTELRAVVPKNVTIVSNRILRIVNLRSGDRFAEQDAPMLDFGGQNRKHVCRSPTAPPRTDETSAVVQLLQATLKQSPQR